MKTLRESLFDQDISLDEMDEVVSRKWIKDNYAGKIKIDFKKHTLSSNELVLVINTDIEYLLPEGWRFEKTKHFFCNNCPNLKSLEGAPSVTMNFSCLGCTSLESLKGSPHTVNGFFSCSECTNLKSLEGAPDRVEGGFICDNCINLKSLKYIPKYIGDGLDCQGCPIEDYSILDKIKIKGDIFK